MASLTYEIMHCERLKELKTATKNSVKQYRQYAITFGAFCKVEYSCRHMEDCRPYIQAYADRLTFRGKSASTIHTYLAGVCRVFGVPLSDIKKPIRHVSENTRSRGVKAADSRTDTTREASPRLYDFAACVGIRRAEYGHLRGDNLVCDESRYLCVEVVKGKGGKYQLQRFLPDEVDVVRSYFDGASRNLFTKAELKNKIDLHRLRAFHAQKAHQYYVDRMKRKPSYRDQLQNEITARWCKYNCKKLRYSELVGQYIIRGKNRTFAQAHSLPISYDRLAVMAVSIFHLSHWRNDVTICNYLLAA